MTAIATPPPSSVYADKIDLANFNYITKQISKLEQTNHYSVQERLRKGCLKKLFVDNLYTEGVPSSHFSVIREVVEELSYDDDYTLNHIFGIKHNSHNSRVYIQPRNYISSGQKHIGNIWIFYSNGTVELYIIKAK
jgi:hypothetical protein